MNPVDVDCPHVATPEEQQRDSSYMACGAAIGQPCVWARRYDGLEPPAYHSERIEAAMTLYGMQQSISKEEFDQEVMNTELV